MSLPLDVDAVRVAHDAQTALSAAQLRLQFMRRRIERADVDCARMLEELVDVEAQLDRAIGLVGALQADVIVRVDEGLSADSDV